MRPVLQELHLLIEFVGDSSCKRGRRALPWYDWRMSFQPDVVVLAPHAPDVSLIAEVKRSFPELTLVESKL